MKRKSLFNHIGFIDFTPAISGLIGKTALVTSFAYLWAKELNITHTDFIFENVRLEIIIGSIITLIAALLLPNVAPSGTLAPLIVLIPAMVKFGVHPFLLSLTVGILGIVFIKTKLFHKLLSLSGTISKISLALTFGISGILLSSKNLLSYFQGERMVLAILIVLITLVYLILLGYKKGWLVIPIAAFLSILIPLIFQLEMDFTSKITFPKFSPDYWWNKRWGIGFHFDWNTFFRTLPFAFFVILLWAIDTISIQAIRDANDTEHSKKEELNIDHSFIIASIRNIIGGLFGGAQTSALWRSYLIPLAMVKRPLRSTSVILGVLGIIVGFTAIPIKVLSYPPLIWTVLLYGIFMPFLLVGMKNFLQVKKEYLSMLIIIILVLFGVFINPIITWAGSVIFEKLSGKIRKF